MQEQPGNEPTTRPSVLVRATALLIPSAVFACTSPSTTASRPAPVATAPQSHVVDTAPVDGAPAEPASTLRRRLEEPRDPPAGMPECPLEIQPGASFGPLRLGHTRAQLEAAALELTDTSHDERTSFAK